MYSISVGLDQVPYDVLHFARGATIFEQASPSRLFFKSMSGWVRLQIVGADGVRKIIAFAGPGDVLGSFIGPQKLSAEAVTPTVLRAYDLGSVLSRFGQCPKIALELLEESERRCDGFIHSMHELLQASATQRVVNFLAELAARVEPEPGSGFVRLPMSREDISDYLGVASGTLSRILTNLQQEGRLRLDGPRKFALRAPRPASANGHAAHPTRPAEPAVFEAPIGDDVAFRRDDPPPHPIARRRTAWTHDRERAWKERLSSRSFQYYQDGSER